MVKFDIPVSATFETPEGTQEHVKIIASDLSRSQCGYNVFWVVRPDGTTMRTAEAYLSR